MPAQPQRDFRWSLLLAPLAVVLTIGLLRQVRPAFTFAELADSLGVGTPAYVRLALLGAVLIGVLLLVKVFRNR